MLQFKTCLTVCSSCWSQAGATVLLLLTVKNGVNLTGICTAVQLICMLSRRDETQYNYANEFFYAQN